MRIDVTWDDIRLGQRGHPDRCALARAVKRQTGVSDVMVTSSGVWVEFDHYTLPRRLREWPARYDILPHWRLFFTPFSFELT